MAERTPRPRDFILVDDPIWCSEPLSTRPTDAPLKIPRMYPSPVFRRIWELIAQVKYGRTDAVLQVARDLGYITEYRDPATDELATDFTRFDYDPQETRKLLGLDPDMPLVFTAEGSPDRIRCVWDRLLGERGT